MFLSTKSQAKSTFRSPDLSKLIHLREIVFDAFAPEDDEDWPNAILATLPSENVLKKLTLLVGLAYIDDVEDLLASHAWDELGEVLIEHIPSAARGAFTLVVPEPSFQDGRSLNKRACWPATVSSIFAALLALGSTVTVNANE